MEEHTERLRSTIRYDEGYFDGAKAAKEAIAHFVETHYCIMDGIGSGHYKTVERSSHPNEPLAKAIRDLDERAF